jgi:hypothetical protein
MENKKLKVEESSQNYLQIVPRDILKLIISYSPYRQWFTISKEVYKFATEIISPLKYAPKYSCCALCWSIGKSKPVAAIHLLKTGLFDPSHQSNAPIIDASREGLKEVVELLLKDKRVYPAEKNSVAFELACLNGHLDIMKMLLNDPRVTPRSRHNNAIRYAAKKGHKEVVEFLLAGIYIGDFYRNSVAAP